MVHKADKSDALNAVVSSSVGRRATCLVLATAMSLFWATASFALDPAKRITQYGHDTWLQQNGLPASAVSASIQSRNGYLWLGTSAGLIRFDGVKFAWVGIDPVETENRETVSALCEASDGSFWVGTAFNGPCRIKDGTIHRYGQPDGLMSNNVNAIYESRAGQIWVGTSNGLYKFVDGKFLSIPLTPGNVTCINEDPKGRLLVGTQAGLRIIEGDKQVRQNEITVVFEGKLITSLLLSRQGEVWIGTHEGLVHWKGGAVKRYSQAEGLTDEHVTAICEDRDNNVWVGTRRRGLNRWSGGKWAAFTTEEGLSDNQVLCITEDHEGSLWIGTSDGLNRLKDVNVTPYTSKDGIPSDYVSSVAETPDGSMYFLSDQGAVITRMKDGKTTNIPTSVGLAYVARDGSLWVGQTGILLKINGTRVTRYTTRDGLPNRWVSAIGEDDKSLLISFDGIGLRRFFNGRIEPFFIRDGQEYTSTIYTSTFHQEPGGALWIGKSCGLERIQGGQLEDFSQIGALSHFWVSSMIDDKNGSLWFSSPIHGLARYRDGTFTFYSSKVGLFTNEIYCVLADDQANLWLSSPRGIGRISRKDLDDVDAGRTTALHSQVYTTADGMKTDECFGQWQPSGWKSHDGRLWFATKKGAVMIDPASIKKNEVPPPVLIENVLLDQRIILPEQLSVLPPGKHQLEIHYTALSLLVPDRVLFKYTLEGYDDGWVDAGSRRVAYYTSLSPGTYRFRVIACNNDGVWNEVGASTTFNLDPLFYQTAWFAVLCGFILIVLTAGLFWWRFRSLKANETQLEGVVQMRTKELLEQRSFLRKIIDLNPSFIFAKDRQGRFTLANRALAESYGSTADELIGKRDPDFNARKDEVDKFLEDDLQVMQSKTDKFIPEEEFTDSNNVQHWMQVMKIPIISENGEAEQVLGVATDITERKRAEEQINASLREKEVLLKEIHHRVKNNLQVISSLLRLQAEHVKDPGSREAFEESMRRIRTMALVHEELYRSRDMSSIDAGKHLKRLANDLQHSYGRGGVGIAVDVDSIFLQIDKAIPCGLMANELVTNAYKHAFPNGRNGTITLRLHHGDDNTIALTVEDDGVGFPHDCDPSTLSSMGMTVVNALTEQVSGTLSLERTRGTKFTIYFPL